MAPSTTDKVHENRLRRLAERQGLRLSKSRRRDQTAPDFGSYQLEDRSTGVVVLKRLEAGFGLSLDDAEERLQNRPLGVVPPDRTVNMDVAKVLAPLTERSKEQLAAVFAPISQRLLSEFAPAVLRQLGDLIGKSFAQELLERTKVATYLDFSRVLQVQRSALKVTGVTPEWHRRLSAAVGPVSANRVALSSFGAAAVGVWSRRSPVIDLQNRIGRDWAEQIASAAGTESFARLAAQLTAAFAPHAADLKSTALLMAQTLAPHDWIALAEAAEVATDELANSVQQEDADPRTLAVEEQLQQQVGQRRWPLNVLLYILSAYAGVLADRTVPERDQLIQLLYQLTIAIRRLLDSLS
jgi:hypothetical protein